MVLGAPAGRPALDLLPTLALLDESARVVRSGGILVANFSTLDRPEWADALLRSLRTAARAGRFGAGVLRPYTAGYVESLYRAVGLEPEHGEYPEDQTPRPGWNYFTAVGRKPRS